MEEQHVGALFCRKLLLVLQLRVTFFKKIKSRVRENYTRKKSTVANKFLQQV